MYPQYMVFFLLTQEKESATIFIQRLVRDNRAMTFDPGIIK